MILKTLGSIIGESKTPQAWPVYAVKYFCFFSFLTVFDDDSRWHTNIINEDTPTSTTAAPSVTTSSTGTSSPVNHHIATRSTTTSSVEETSENTSHQQEEIGNLKRLIDLTHAVALSCAQSIPDKRN